MNNTINTLDFGVVAIRKTHINGQTVATIDLSDNGTKEAFAQIKHDLKTGQPFAVLLDDELNVIV